MISDKEIYQAATVLTKRYGDDAPIHAAMRADELMNRIDLHTESVTLEV